MTTGAGLPVVSVGDSPEAGRPRSAYAAWSAVMADVQQIGKGDTNDQFNYRFRGVDAVINAVGPVLRAHRVLVLPIAVAVSRRDVSTSGGRTSHEISVEVTYRIVGPGGDFFEARSVGEAMDLQDKGTAKAMSVAFRILFLQALCIPTGDPDPDESAPTRAATPRPKRQVRADTEPGVVTDAVWLADMRERVAEALTPGQLRALWAETVTQKKTGRLADPDGIALQQYIAERGETFGPAAPPPAGGGWPDPAPIPAAGEDGP